MKKKKSAVCNIFMNCLYDFFLQQAEWAAVDPANPHIGSILAIFNNQTITEN